MGTLYRKAVCSVRFPLQETASRGLHPNLLRLRSTRKPWNLPSICGTIRLWLSRENRQRQTRTFFVFFSTSSTNCIAEKGSSSNSTGVKRELKNETPSTNTLWNFGLLLFLHTNFDCSCFSGERTWTSRNRKVQIFFLIQIVLSSGSDTTIKNSQINHRKTTRFNVEKSLREKIAEPHYQEVFTKNKMGVQRVLTGLARRLKKKRREWNIA